MLAGESAPNDLRLVNGTIELTLDLRVYRLSAITKTAYRMAARCTAVLGAQTGQNLAVSLRFKPTTTEAGATEAARSFFEELLDQELREQIAAETAPVRALILAHAFSKIDLIKRDDD
jgi:His-Xaa-Ser system protein HxsD